MSKGNFCHIHVSLIPVVGAVGEQKSKPTQHSVTSLRAAGLIPDIIVCRSAKPVEQSVRDKVSLFSMVENDRVISVHDVGNIYNVPGLLLNSKVCHYVLNSLHFKDKIPPTKIPLWDSLAYKLTNCNQTVMYCNCLCDFIFIFIFFFFLVFVLFV